LCYAYAPWAVPLFAPWALLPFPFAFGLWRAATIIGLGWTTVWAGRRRPVLTALLFLAISVPVGINLDTGNVTLPLVLLIWLSRRWGPSAVGIAWGLATGLKWVSAPLWLLLSPAARRAGLAALAVTALADLVLWTGTLRQVLTVANMDRPFPFDYLVLLWAAVPWVWTDAGPLRRLRGFVALVRRPQIAWRLSRRRMHRAAPQ
ncbi:MAG TPA: glycosyltransferase 87 family protein, partial [Candidatus Limnocylindria bacterium]|nr:glycosyltransferase 87 family protein [Candidatus Limnocylindria bacterium]